MNRTDTGLYQKPADYIREAFKDGKAFIPFITCGDPDLETTEKIVRSMAENGADLIDPAPPRPTLPDHFPTQPQKDPLFKTLICVH